MGLLLPLRALFTLPPQVRPDAPLPDASTVFACARARAEGWPSVLLPSFS